MTNFGPVNRAFEGADEVFPSGQGPCALPRTPLDQGPLNPGNDPAEQLAHDCALLPLNDFGNGKRFTAYFGENVLFIPRVGWFVWDGKCWVQDDDALEVRRVAQKVSAKVTAEAEFIRLEDWEAAQVADGELAREADDDAAARW